MRARGVGVHEPEALAARAELVAFQQVVDDAILPRGISATLSVIGEHEPAVALCPITSPEAYCVVPVSRVIDPETVIG